MAHLYGLSFLAGLLTILSPCVLPVLPLVVGGAAQQHRLGPLFLAGGLVLSFASVGLAIAAAGSLFNPDLFRNLAALLLLMMGLALLVPQIQGYLSRSLTGLESRGQSALGSLSDSEGGVLGQFAVGALLGVVWSPCIGPTLGAAIGLASQAGGLAPAGVMMLLFGLGSVVPLLFIAYGSRRLFLRYRGSLLQWGQRARGAFALLMVGLGVAILLGIDKWVEARALALLPEAWISLTAKY